MINEQFVAALLLGVAVHRAWRVIALDQITEPLRARLIEREGRGWEFLTDMVLCPWCLGFWIAGAGALTLTLTQGWPILGLLLVWLASSGIAGILASLTED